MSEKDELLGAATMDSCGDCRFWCGRRDWKGSIGDCRRYPTFIERAHGDCCGEHQPMSAKAAEGVNGELLAALKDVVYEIKHHNHQKRDGSYDCLITGSTLQSACDSINRAEEASR